MKTFKRIIGQLAVLGIIIMLMGEGLWAAGDVLVNFRFYEGLRGEDTRETRVVTSYYLRPLLVGNIVPVLGVNQEKDELKRIFNLKDLKLMTQTQWGWQEHQKDQRSQVIFLDGHEFVISTTRIKGQDGFRLVVTEKGKASNNNKVLLDTEIVLPEEKNTVFGFEDSQAKPYFLSLFREKDETVIREDLAAVGDGQQPQLLKRVSPVYPIVALKAAVQGTVTLKVVIDTNGKVKRLGTVSGHPLLRNAAVKAVSQWEYRPYMVKGKASEAEFTVNVAFSLPKDIEGSRESSEAEASAEQNAVPAVWPTRGYLTSTFGNRIHPFTGKKAFHNGLDIATKEGTKVVATADGEVIAAEFREEDGNYIVIDHKNGYKTYYGRLKAFTVKKGQRVKRFDLIGYVGSTGSSSAPHLHYEVYFNDKPVNPVTFIGDRPQQP